jgi:hypothetical protein
MTEPLARGTIDGGVIDRVELANLVRRVMAVLPGLNDETEDVRRKQLDALAVVLDEVATRLSTDPPRADDRDELATALSGSGDRALITARRIAAAERRRMASPNWSLFS